MHDIADLESRGIPSVNIATEAFTEAAAAQALSLGTDPAVVFIEHPIQNRTDDEIRALADTHIDQILNELVAN